MSCIENMPGEIGARPGVPMMAVDGCVSGAGDALPEANWLGSLLLLVDVAGESEVVVLDVAVLYWHGMSYRAQAPQRGFCSSH